MRSGTPSINAQYSITPRVYRINDPMTKTSQNVGPGDCLGWPPAEFMPSQAVPVSNKGYNVGLCTNCAVRNHSMMISAVSCLWNIERRSYWCVDWCRCDCETEWVTYFSFCWTPWLVPPHIYRIEAGTEPVNGGAEIKPKSAWLRST